MIKKQWLLLVVSFLLLKAAAAQQKETRTLIVFFDGLRPDYITPELMPNLYAFKKQGGYGKQHHSVFPTVTRVNSASYSTGSYPVTHGLMGNSVFFPQVSPAKSLSSIRLPCRPGLTTGNRDRSMPGYRLPATGYRLPATGYRLRAAGRSP